MTLRSAPAIAFAGVSDLDRAGEFCGDTLGPALTDGSPFALLAEMGATMLRITAVGAPVVAAHTVLGRSVPDIATAVDELAARGVPFSRFEGLEQGGREIWAAPGRARIARSTDPDGNGLSRTQFS